jgi:Transmembrane amino acid transporter protein
MAAAGGTGPVLATIILLVFGILSWYSLISFARAAETTLVQQPQSPSPHRSNQKSVAPPATASGESLSAVWERIVPHGSSTKYIPDLGCVCLTIGCLLFYSAFIGDLFGSLISGITSIPTMYRKRWSILLLLHAMPILPLCLIKDLSALKYSSMTGLVGIVYTIAFVAIRLWDGSYAPGGKYHALMPTKFQPAAQIEFPSSTVTKSVFGFVADLPLFHSSKGLLILMNMCCVACTYIPPLHFPKKYIYLNLHPVSVFAISITQKKC